MKNKLMRAATLLLVLTLMTSCFVGSTFAKYTTSSTGSDQARVAKWGFTAPASLAFTDLFKTAYDETVSSTVDVIAPGTWGTDTIAFTYDTTNNGSTKPEVDYTFVVSTGTSFCEDDIKNNTNIKWALVTGSVADVAAVADAEWKTWDDLMTEIQGLDGNVAGDKYEAGTLPEAFKDGNNIYSVVWKWAFDDADDAPFAATDKDSTDTGMGNAATLAKCKVEITITATQVN